MLMSVRRVRGAGEIIDYRVARRIVVIFPERSGGLPVKIRLLSDFKSVSLLAFLPFLS